MPPSPVEIDKLQPVPSRRAPVWSSEWLQRAQLALWLCHLDISVVYQAYMYNRHGRLFFTCICAVYVLCGVGLFSEPGLGQSATTFTADKSRSHGYSALEIHVSVASVS